MRDLRIVPAGDAALLVEWEAAIDPVVSNRAIGLADRVRSECAASVRDVVVGYCSVTVYFDPLAVDSNDLERDVRHLAVDLPEQSERVGPVIEVGVCYGGEFGPDLTEVAAVTRLEEQEVVALHAAPIYRVYVVGFVPGFAYMASLDPRLALSRRATPRTRVPAGSVAIAAGQTGIYPSETPGGWHLIGRTAVKPYDETRTNPFLFKPGDRVRFHPVEPGAYERIG